MLKCFTHNKTFTRADARAATYIRPQTLENHEICGIIQFIPVNAASLLTASSDFSSIGSLLDEVGCVCQVWHLSLRTEESYLFYIREFIPFYGRRHSAKLGAAELSGYLSYLTVEKQVVALTQNMAFSALLFLYRSGLEQELPREATAQNMEDPARAQRQKIVG